MKRLLIPSFWLIVTVSASALAVEYPIIEAEGVIHQVDYANNTAVINGVKYRFDTASRVEIAGTFGAFTMLTAGMKVEFVYEWRRDGISLIRELSQLPDSYVLEET